VILSLQDVTKSFGGLTAVDRVSLDVRETEILSIIGPNGAGKTTLFNVLTGLHRPDSGRILFGGRDVAGLPPERIAAHGIGRTFQNIRLFAAMTVFENVMVGLHLGCRYGYIEAVLRAPVFFREERKARDDAWRCSTTWGSRTAPRISRGTCPTARSGAWRSPGRSR